MTTPFSSILPGNIPGELKDRAQWVVWKLEVRQGKSTKVPYCALDFNNASVSDASTWATFDEVKAAFESGGYSGIGFVFTKDDPFVGVDLDKCRDSETGDIQPWAKEILDCLKSYAEVSQSATGVHVIVKGKLPGNGRRKQVSGGGAIEVYDQGRFFVMTGNHLEGPETIDDCSHALDELYVKTFGTSPEKKPASKKARDVSQPSHHEEPQKGRLTFAPASSGPRGSENDEELLRKARDARNGEKFSALFDLGDLGEYEGDDSRADLALCCHLAYWTGNDFNRIDRLFRRSKLSRPKWDEKRGETTYGYMTIEKALINPTQPELQEASESYPDVSTALVFPPDAIIGSVGDLAKELARGTEVPEEFFFAAGLTMLGAICDGDLQLDIGFDVQPRLYTVLLGDSYEAKKSTAMKKTIEFFEQLKVPQKPRVIYGVGSAEGLGTVLQESHHVVLAYDELKSFIEKTKVQGSVLLPMVTALFEQNRWQNITKNKKKSQPIEDANLSMIGCCTTATFSDMWTTEAISIGFPNRLFVVNADRKGKVAWPSPPDEKVLAELRVRIQTQIARLPLTLPITPEAKQAWEDWYNNLPSSEHTRRLDTIGFRLLGLVALITDKDSIDLETVNTVRAILNYELNVRIVTDPVDADGKISKLEEKIRRSLQAKGPLSRRNLRRATHADREGLWAFDQAIKNLERAGDITVNKSLYRLIDFDDATAVTESVAKGGD